jgi:branched-chain amino acid transport system ATP-binding protein
MHQRTLFRLLLALLCVAWVQTSWAATSSATETKRILIITGEDYPGHKWKQTTPVLKGLYKPDPRLQVEVLQDLSQLASTDLAAYAAVVMHFKNYDPNVPGRQAFDKLCRFVDRGGGLVLVHFACGAFQEFKDDFTKLAGRAWNPKLRGHDPFGEFTVNMTAQPHPITTGLQPFQICQMGMARTFQIVKPFPTISVFDNVMVGALSGSRSRRQAEEVSREIIMSVGLEKMKNKEAQGLPLPLRKRLEVARALATQPSVILLDEVMAGLNPTEVDEMIGLIKMMNRQGISVLLIEHVMRGVMALSQRVVVINYGKKIAEGSPREIVKNREVIEAYLGKEFLSAQD